MKSGYKTTKVGVIPDNWNISTLSALSREPMQNGVFFKPSLKGSGVRLINVGDLYNSAPIDSDTLELFDATEKERERFKVEDGDLFFTRSSVVPSGIAHCNIYRAPRREAVVFDSHVIRMRPDIRKVDPSYLFRFCVASVARHYLISNAKTATMTTIDQGVLGKCPVILPPIAEQKAIVEALSDADTLIASLEQLITKKRQIKQGAMQELLTGKRRLPGFSGEWEVRTLKDAMNCLDNLRVPLNESQRNQMRGDYPYCGANGVLDFVNDYVIDEDILLIAEDGGYFDEYAYRPIAYRMTGKCWVNNHAHILKAKEGFDQGFLYYSLVHKNILSFLASGTRAKLNKSEMWKIEIFVPLALSEQTAIATILSDMDCEIAALEANLTKTRFLKQGMMHNLLTGRIRLL